jgi:hypothetical protein
MNRVSFVSAAAALLAGALPALAGPHQIRVEPWGPSPQLIESTRASLENHRDVRSVLRGTRHRLLAFELVDEDKSQPPTRYEATFFDYTRNRAYVVAGRFGSSRVTVTRSEVQPPTSDEEFAEAVRILRRDETLGPALRKGKLVAYPPMPPLLNEDLPVSETRRTVAVGLAASSPGALALKPGVADHEIVGVDMGRRRAERFEKGAPTTSLVTAAACGAPNARQSTTSRGTAGSFNVVITRGGVELWNFVAVRPSASSGRRGSGLELRSVRYRGKSVLARAHVPILNVKYEGDRCGPYRDWQWQEGSFVANGTNVASGVRRATAPPTTMVDTNVDQGNFRGLAFHDDGTSVQLATEMQAGWYRYVMKWNLKDDGTIQPRFGFAGVSNSCICNVHNHHAYWRFDFDVVSASRNAVCVSAAAGQPCTAVPTERRLATVGSFLEVSHTQGPEKYRLVPGHEDGAPDTYSRGTAWLLADVSNQVDDGVNCTSGRSCHTDIDIDKFVNGQSISDGDLVVWYRGSFVHDESGGMGEIHLEDHDGGHVVGPELVPMGW